MATSIDDQTEYNEKAFTKLEPLSVIVPITFPFNHSLHECALFLKP